MTGKQRFEKTGGKRPENETGEENGRIKDVQLSDREMRERDMSRGAEGKLQRIK